MFHSFSEVLSSARCIVTSEYNCEALAAVYKVPAAATIPPALDFSAFPIGGTPEPRTVAYPGRLTPSKGALDALCLVGQLANSYGPLTLLLSDPEQRCYGESDQYLKALRNTAATLRNLKVEFSHHNSSPLDIYSRAALTLCLPQAIEGFGLVPLESLAVGRPVVVTPTGGMSWALATPGIAVVPGRNVIALASAIVEILEDWPAWHLRACEARDQLMRRFDVGTVAEQHIGLYEQVGG
jgi:glycosyltransferase involved in cell wall biosynthesis